MKRIISILLAAAMLAALLQGCGGNQSATGKSGQTTAPATTKNETTTTAAPTTATTTEAPKEVKKPKVTIVIGNVPTDPALEPPAKVIAEVTGYDIEYVVLPADSPGDVLSLNLASGKETIRSAAIKT